MSQSDDEQQARVTRSLQDSLADYTPPANGELYLPEFDEDDEVADDDIELDADERAANQHNAALTQANDNPVPPVQAAFDGWSTSYDQVDSGIKAEPDDFRPRPQVANDIESSFDITRVFSQTGSKIQRQSKEWGSATVAVFAARKEQHNLIWLGLAAVIAIVALIWLFKPGQATAPTEQLVTIDPAAQQVVTSDSAAPSQVHSGAAVMESAPPVIGVPSAPATTSTSTPVTTNSAQVASTPTTSPAKTTQVYQPVERAAVVSKPAVSQPAASSPVANKPVVSKSQTATKAGYTVQIAAAHNEANVKALAAKLPRPNDAQIVRSWRDGKPWYVLSYGHYKSREEAARARDSLPAAVRAGNAPWVKAL